MRTMKEMLVDRKLFRTITLYFDIETFQYNEQAGKDRPSDYRNMTFSVAVSWIEAGQVEYEIFPNFKAMFDQVVDIFKNVKKKPTIELNAHNTNKYDNHFLRYDLLHFYPFMNVENYWLNSATTEESNENTLRIKDLTKKHKKGIILEKRIKSSINLEMIIFLEGIQFVTVDNWVKTNSSLKMLGKKLKRLGVVSDDELKTDFDYLKYNKSVNMSEGVARRYADDIFNSLTPDELTYIRNDVILLAKSAYYYSELFNGFDYSKKTFTSNILESYNSNDLTSFQLLNRVGSGKGRHEVRYTDYRFADQNFYDYLKPFYRGGLNFYNQFKVGKIITSGMFSMDIHSSYPYTMHNFKIPTYLTSFTENSEPTETPINYSNDFYTLYQLTKETFDTIILNQIDSIILKQILVKYYSTTDTINLNTYTFKMIENITGIRFESIPALSSVTFETDYFGSRDQIEEFYRIKTQGKESKKLDFKSPYDIKRTDQTNDIIYSEEEVANSKVNLNGLYGIPALRPYFNLFRKNEEGDYYNITNGHKNAERNIVFSIFVTSVSLWNLLDPLQYLSQQEIDKHFIYCDTDSLYFEKEIQHKMPDKLFTDFNLGTWELEHDNITHFYVMNHKKYAFIDPDDLEKDGTPKGIQVRSGGIPHDSFNRDMTFESFISSQFSHGSEVPTKKSIYNDQGTISIYSSITKLEVGSGYRLRSNSELYDTLKDKIIKEARENIDEFTSDVLYIESVIGTFSVSDITPFKNKADKKPTLEYLQVQHKKMRQLINN